MNELGTDKGPIFTSREASIADGARRWWFALLSALALTGGAITGANKQPDISTEDLRGTELP